MEYYLGLDGGGTKTASVILDADHRECGRGNGGPCNIAVTAISEIDSAIRESVASALSNAGLPHDLVFESVCAGVAGFSARSEREEFSEQLPYIVNSKRYRVEPDYTIAYWGASGGAPGLMISAGTGTVFYGRNESGKAERYDGIGYLLGDGGSGFQIGQRALSAAAQQLLANNAPSKFVTAVLDHIGGTGLDDIIEWTYRDFSSGKIASLVPVIVQLAESGDEAAIKLITVAVMLLRGGALITLIRLEMDPETTNIYPLGGLFSIPMIRNRFVREPGGFTFNLIDPLNTAAYGAALLAMD